jgi:hypothetical protein
METIFNLIHKSIAYAVTYVTLFLVDLPLKICLSLLAIILAVVVSIFYPIVKHFRLPNWIEALHQYATKSNKTIAHKVWKAWS